jgi:hypothetical protein
MDYEHYQAINTLLKERISDLEGDRYELKTAARHLVTQADPDTEVGQEAYENLNRVLNRRRVTDQKLRKWRSVHAAFKHDMGLALDDKNSWVRLSTDKATGYLTGMLNVFRSIV